MFWGLRLQAGKVYSLKIHQPIRVTGATLDKDIKMKGNDFGVWIKKDGMSYLITSVSRNTPHVALNLEWSVGEELIIHSKGNVYLSGFYNVEFDYLANDSGSSAPVEVNDQVDLINVLSDENVRNHFEQPATNDEIKTNKQLKKIEKNDYITLEEGVQAKDLVVTEGVRAKNGDKVVIAYKGQLESDNSGDMDENILSDQEYGFTLGAGEVIRGFDIAIEGMSVGAKRKIVCPPHTAYGEDGIPSVIPANETISFEVELLSVC